MFQVNDADRVLQFEGEHLSFASSQRPGVDRWAEFNIYRTVGGTYVVSRVGRSRVYHAEGCQVIRRGRHHRVQAATLGEDAAQCPQCWSPEAREVLEATTSVYPERAISWAAVCNTAESAVEALAKYDVDGNRYFTNVARTLIRDAASRDQALSEAYYLETIV